MMVLLLTLLVLAVLVGVNGSVLVSARLHPVLVCSILVVDCTADNEEEALCSKHGDCEGASGCSCHAGWTGSDCETRKYHP